MYSGRIARVRARAHRNQLLLRLGGSVAEPSGWLQKRKDWQARAALAGLMIALLTGWHSQ